MNIHEYQAKQLLQRFAIPIPTGAVAATPAEAVAAATKLGGTLWVIKAQVHAGGRGKAGGVQLAHSPAEAGQVAAAMLGTRLVTKQTGPQGMPVHQVYVESGSHIERELYLSLLVDRSRERLAMIASASGGMDIEAVAATTPEKFSPPALIRWRVSSPIKPVNLATVLGSPMSKWCSS